MATGSSSSSVDTAKLNLQGCLRIVKSISKAVSNCEDSSFPSTLLRLLPCLEAGALSAKDFSLIKNQIWKDGLIHLMIEVLRNDYSCLEEHWRILTNLAITMASVLAGLTPMLRCDKPSSTSSPETDTELDQVKEYYEIILPTATDSVLILANSILEAADDLMSQTTPMQDDPVSLQECFKKTLDSLVWLCASHQQCITRTLQSPYFLHILITDNVFYGHVSLGALETLILSDKSSIASIPQNVLMSILDELVYKMSGKEERGALLSFRLLAQLAALSPELMDTLTSRYSGLIELAKRWVRPDQTIGLAEKNLIARLGSHEVLPQQAVLPLKGKVNVDEYRSAVIIQACWRGYSCRKKVVKIKRGIRRFQQLYRRRKEGKERQKKIEERAKVEAAMKQRGLMSSKLAFHEKQLSLYEQLPASELQEYVRLQETNAAVTIQSAWRAWAIRSKYREYKSKATLHKSALVIQRALRKYLQQKRERSRPSHDSAVLPKITGVAREELQREVACHRQLHPPSGYKSEEEVRSLHDKVQQMYEEFYLSRATQRRNDEKAQLLLSQLNRNSEFLLGVPSLEQSVATRRPDLVETLSSHSSSVARMAKMAHKEEMKSLNTPWWKRPPLDHDELVL